MEPHRKEPTPPRPNRSRPALGRPLAVLALAAMTFAAAPARAADDPAYVAVTNQRAEKIVGQLDLTDSAQSTRVRDIIARHYRDLSAFDNRRASKDATEKSAAEAAVVDLHFAFLGALGAELTPAQVDQVKDGLTYGVMPGTYRVYLQMLPDLTPDQQRQIKAWLIEAREHAMDAGSSEKKHGWFGKYKGRINNYLAKAGYDLKQAEHDMFARQKSR